MTDLEPDTCDVCGKLIPGDQTRILFINRFPVTHCPDHPADQVQQVIGARRDLLLELAQMAAEMTGQSVPTPAHPTLEAIERVQGIIDEHLEARQLVLTFMTEHRDDERLLMDVIADAPEVERRVVLEAIDRLGGWTLEEG